MFIADPSAYSRQALKKYVQANNNLSSVTEAAFTTQFNRALAKGSESGVFERPKGKHLVVFDPSWDQRQDRSWLNMVLTGNRCLRTREDCQSKGWIPSCR
ncbi:hypothetical protein AUEXF2481DRAFT_41789 [Aureobasidium subglaciale EXF-2481]|uniref:Histone H1 n=1 Tax=Aureobasidium subglaciale (strain EXF-2481) TaxID=1043005 RepID=A0A074Y6Y5_AURSE|nr:uncharacterized protein AUEXF2481DRAFT_41789 [Aureobasidium subglaciale EXF-2481]KEQ93548.1 hypothetical protein AUEXF2481DRAFT_41789 [Aureobasidium subglaciale EXF-2481]